MTLPDNICVHTKADSLNAAVEMAKGCPVLKGGAKITVYETLKAM
jgi:hypothetical protein